MRTGCKVLTQRALLVAMGVLTGTLMAGDPDPVSFGKVSKTRHFELVYGALLKELPVGSKVRVWMPLAPSNRDQQVQRIKTTIPSKPLVTREPKYGNQILYFETETGKSSELEFSVTYQVQRSEVTGLNRKDARQLTEDQRRLFLSANVKVPIDGKPVALLKELELPRNDSLKLGELLYRRVEKHMRYDKSKPGYGTGDAVWACDSRFGNCTDFHSLFISMARSQGVPSRFEIGFPIPEKQVEGMIGGYHCWAFFHVKEYGWVPVDISEADKHPELKQYYFGNLTENRVTFTTGRDINLVPRQEAPPLNFFVYPHVEVDGKPWNQKHMEKRFRFKNL